jgi:hypothetical protein
LSVPVRLATPRQFRGMNDTLTPHTYAFYALCSIHVVCLYRRETSSGRSFS